MSALHAQGRAVSPLDVLLARLEGVQRAGRGYRANCPACGGSSRKLSVCEAEDERVLLHCFAGCLAADVLGAIGLSLVDLYPGRIREPTPEGRRAAHAAFKQSAWSAALGVLAVEATVVEVAAAMIHRSEPLSADDMERIRTASRLIHSAREVLA